MPLARITERDPNLPHQIVLMQSRSKPHTHIAISCNCRRVLNKTAYVHEVFAEIHASGDPWTHYNDPRNHLNEPTPFTPGQSTRRVWVP